MNSKTIIEAIAITGIIIELIIISFKININEHLPNLYAEHNVDNKFR